MVEKEKKEQDTQIDAQTSEQTQLVDTGLVKPLPNSEESSAYLTGPLLGSPETKPRKKTAGEVVFDWSVYGGFGFLANEVVSGLIVNRTLKEGKTFYGAYEKTLNGLHKLAGQTEGASHWKGFIKRPVDVFIMTFGGTLMVLPIKICEDFKGKLVRFFDETFTKDEAKKPEVQKAHAEMDAAPKQSWGSLGQGRAVTIGAAVGVDYLTGGKDAVSTKLLKNTKLDKWSSLERINTQVTRKIAKIFEPEMKDAIIRSAKEHPYEIQDIEGKIATTGRTYGFLLFLSAALAAGFYVSSHMFAKGRENKKQQHDDVTPGHAPHVGRDTAENTTAHTDQLDHATASKTEAPLHTVTQAHALERIHHNNQEAVSV